MPDKQIKKVEDEEDIEDVEENPEDSVKNGVIQQFLKNQSNELQLRAEELDLQKQELKCTHEINKIGLSEQVAHLREQRKHDDKNTTKRYIFWAVTTFMVLFFGFSMAFIGKEAFLEKSIEYLFEFAKFVAGGFFGYAIAVIKYKSDKEEDDDE